MGRNKSNLRGSGSCLFQRFIDSYAKLLAAAAGTGNMVGIVTDCPAC